MQLGNGYGVHLQFKITSELIQANLNAGKEKKN